MLLCSVLLNDHSVISRFIRILALASYHCQYSFIIFGIFVLFFTFHLTNTSMEVRIIYDSRCKCLCICILFGPIAGIFFNMDCKGCCTMILLKEDSAEMESASTVSSRVTSTAKALRILDCFSPARTELTLAQISRLLSMPKSTLLNQIRTLEEAGYLLRIRDGQPTALGTRSCSSATAPRRQSCGPVMHPCDGGPAVRHWRHHLPYLPY